MRQNDGADGTVPVNRAGSRAPHQRAQRPGHACASLTAPGRAHRRDPGLDLVVKCRANLIVADLPDLATNRLPEFGALLGLPQIMLGGKAGPQAVDQRACRTDHLQQPVPALLLQKVVRVLAFRQHGQPRRLARLQQRQQPFKRAFLGALPAASPSKQSTGSSCSFQR